jgi:hypothetical protein
MANYMGMARSNYFRVNNLEKFDEFCTKFNLKSMQSQENGEHYVGFISESDGGLNFEAYDDSGEILPGNITEDLAKLLYEDDVAIFMEIGNEKMRYLSGFAYAVNAKGEEKKIDLGDIYLLAHELTKYPKNISPCEY